MTNCNLRNLLKKFRFKNIPNIILKDITIDSRLVKKNSLFLAIKGNKLDGYNYILEAINNGSVAVLAEANESSKSGYIQYFLSVPIIYIKNLKNEISFISSKFYQHPAKKMKLISVTGTNGKTTITYLISQLANYIGKKSAIISTIGNGFLDNIKNTENTTDSAIEIQKNLKLFHKNNVNLVVIETSSHALIQSRVLFIPFEIGIFSNLGLDHFDYHKNISSYEKAKWLLFSTHKTKNQIINIDDPVGLKWIKNLPKACVVSIDQKIPLSFNGNWLKVNKININKKYYEIYFDSVWGSGKIDSPLIGIFNVSNLMLSISSLLMLNYPIDSLIRYSNKLQEIPGRMESFITSNFPKVFIDYAHNPVALKNALITLRTKTDKKIWCIFGCGGERCKNKRFFMGKIAEKYSDYVIITNDNPRNENEDLIIQNILSGFCNSRSVIVIKERYQAIQYAILKASKSDCILIAGKGHETYQIIKDSKFFYSDKKVVLQIFREKK